MATDINIDDLLRQDEEALKAKRKRLRAFAGALEESRSASQKTTAAAVELLDSGDLSRAELATVFQLTKGERATLIPAATRRGSAHAPVESSDGVADSEDGARDQN